MAVEAATATRAERARTGAARLCLNMIVKDESAIVERCLASVAPAISHYVVCDTGSTDDSVERARRAGAARRTRLLF